MNINKIKSTITLPLELSECWRFFSNPENLKKITPPDMEIIITSEFPDKTYAGQIISYKMSVLPFIKITWVTEISHLKEGQFFVDEQRFGPYKFWHHQHIFNKSDFGTEVTDFVHYIVPFGFLGSIAHKLFIRKKLESIFKYRTEYLRKKFGRIEEETVES